MEWIKIDRDENSRITDDVTIQGYVRLDSLNTNPCFVVFAYLNHCDYLTVTQLMNIGK